jgi:hypothetical protein
MNAKRTSYLSTTQYITDVIRLTVCTSWLLNRSIPSLFKRQFRCLPVFLQGVSRGIVNILGDGSMDYSE